MTTQGQCIYFENPKNLTRESMKCILEGLKSNRVITKLQIAWSETPNCCDLIVNALKVNKVLRAVLIIRAAVKSDEEVKMLAEALKTNSTLREVRVDNCCASKLLDFCNTFFSFCL